MRSTRSPCLQSSRRRSAQERSSACRTGRDPGATETPAFLLGSEAGAFLIQAEPHGFDFVGPDQPVLPAEDPDEDDLDAFAFPENFGGPMTQRRIWLCDHRGRNAIVVLVSRRRAAPLGHRDAAGAPVRFSRHIKSTADTNFDSLSRQHGEPEALAQALVAGDPDLDIEAAGRETGACDRVYVGHDGKPLYSATMLEVICDRDGKEIQRRPPEMVPANLVPDCAPGLVGQAALVPRGNQPLRLHPRLSGEARQRPGVRLPLRACCAPGTSARAWSWLARDHAVLGRSSRSATRSP